MTVFAVGLFFLTIPKLHQTDKQDWRSDALPTYRHKTNFGPLRDRSISDQIHLRNFA